MKKYNSIGKLFIDYRIFRDLSQSDFASKIDVDIRTIQRWESNDTLVKQEKEEDIVNITLFPYQLIRNLNALKPIPTYYDFRINKYALTKNNSELPEASWFKGQLENKTKRVRLFNFEKDFDPILRYLKFHKEVPKNIIQVIRESINILPEMNLFIVDELGFYSGHTLFFPINEQAFDNLKSKKIMERDLSLKDLVNYKFQDKVFLYGFDISADCNHNIFYIFNQVLRFFRDLPNQNYTFCATALRYDTEKLVDEMGLEVIWKEEKRTNQLGLEVTRRFHAGNFKKFLSDLELY